MALFLVPEKLQAFVYEPLAPMKHPENNQPSPEKIKLGKRLFFDPVLSGNNKMSCSTCHLPEKGWGDQRPRALGHRKKILDRNTPTILNSGYLRHLFWDGRSSTLEEQVLVPIQSPVEMNQSLDELMEELNRDASYRKDFEQAFGDPEITRKRLAQAIACFERTVVTGETPYDRYWKGDRKAMSPSAVRGMKLFFGKAKCSICHNGPRFTDDQFHNIGISGFTSQTGKMSDPENDPGRYAVTGEKFHLKAFKTPGLRGLRSTAPYMHNGIFRTLEEVINFYDSGGANDLLKSPFITSIGMTLKEKKDLIEFLISLEDQN